MLDFSVQFNLIAFCVVAAVGGILLVGGIITAATIKRRRIGILYVLYYILTWLALIAALSLSLLALVGRFGLFGLSLRISGSDVFILSSGAELFPIPFIGELVNAVTGAIMMEITVYAVFAAALFSAVICPLKWRRRSNDYIIPVRRPSEGDGYVTVEGAFYCRENVPEDDEGQESKSYSQELPEPVPSEPELENRPPVTVIDADTLLDDDDEPQKDSAEVNNEAENENYSLSADEEPEEEVTVQEVYSDEPTEDADETPIFVKTDTPVYVKPEVVVKAEEKQETLPQVKSLFADYMPDLSMIKTIVRRPRRNARRAAEDDEAERVTAESVTETAKVEQPEQKEDIKQNANPPAVRRRRTVVKSNAAKAFGDYINTADEEEQKRIQSVVDTVVVTRNDE